LFQQKPKDMNFQRIKSLQKEYGFDNYQELINSGHAWTLEGSVGRDCDATLVSGACMLPKTSKANAYGGSVPSRDDLKKGTKGTFQNSVRFWSDVELNGMNDEH
jgi:hypothetical protein